MDSPIKKRGFTLIELLVVITIIGILIGILLPAVQAVREAARRTTCINNMKQIGIALHNFHSTQNHFPGSGQITTSSGGGTSTVGGWSFLVMLLPYIEMGNLYNTLQISGDPTQGTSGFSSQGTTNYGTNAQVATATSIPTYVCQSNPNAKYLDPNGQSGSPPAFALTNYKAMGATCMASLAFVTNRQSQAPPYGSASQHPDGAMYPGNGSRIGDIMDGTAHTIMCVETCDNTQSVWTLGTDATLVGMPCSQDPQSTNPTGVITGFTNTPTTNGGSNSAGSFYMPQGATGTFDDTGAITGLQSGTPYSQFRTYLSFDFRLGVGADSGKYPPFNVGNQLSNVQGTGGSSYTTAVQTAETVSGQGAPPSTTPNCPVYGPSSGHSAIVNHLMADGSVHCLSKTDRLLGLHVPDHQERERSEPADSLMTWFDRSRGLSRFSRPCSAWCPSPRKWDCPPGPGL